MQRVAVLWTVAIVGCILATPLEAQLFDNLKCHKVRDPVRVRGLVDLAALQPQFSDSGCQLGNPKLFCAPVAKTLVSPPIVPPEIAGQPLTHDYICYKLKCPSQPGPAEVVDAFGTRTLGEFKSSLICLPARKTAVRTPCGPQLTCDSQNEICVSRGPAGPSVTYSCDPVPIGCEVDRSCACVGTTLCQPIFDTCRDIGPNEIFCECVECQ
jgi:hypothetical protein